MKTIIFRDEERQEEFEIDEDMYNSIKLFSKPHLRKISVESSEDLCLCVTKNGNREFYTASYFKIYEIQRILNSIILNSKVVVNDDLTFLNSFYKF